MSYDTERVKNALILMPDKHMGNVVVSLKAIKVLTQLYKGKRVHILIDDAYREVLEAAGESCNLVLYPRNALKTKNLFRRCAVFLDFMYKIRRLTPDIAVDLECRELSSTLTFISGAPVRIGSSSAKRAFFYNKKVDMPRGRHRINSYLAIAGAAGSGETASFLLKAQEPWKASLKNILELSGVAEDAPVACIHAGAGKIYKQWETEGFVAISAWLADRGFQVVLIGGAGEAEKNDDIISRSERKIYNLAGKLSLGELTALFEKCSFYLGNDSGPMHLASAAGTPVIALFGPASESRWGPLTDKAVVLRGKECLEKCGGKDCHYNFRCIRAIPVDDVKNAVTQIIERSKNN